MKFGFKTRLWGPHISNLQEVLDLIAEAGYQGVEFSQRPEDLGCENCNELIKLLRDRNLTLLNLTCGSIDERLLFLDNYKTSYFSIRHGDITRIPDLIHRGYSPALHPGVFNPIRRISDALRLANEYPNINFLIDTAHCTIAGDNPVQAIKSLKDNVIAIHLKDWTPEFGRSGPRYARGFTTLGTGIVKLEETLTQLQKDKFEGWVVVEAENSIQGEIEVLKNNTLWLSERGYLFSHQEEKSYPTLTKPAQKHHRVHQSYISDARFRENVLIAATKESEHFYPYIAQALIDLTKCDLLTIWAVSPSQKQMGLLFSNIPILATPISGLVIKTDEALSGIAIERQASITRFDLTKLNPGGEFGFPNRKLEHSELTEGILPKQMISIPIYNSDHKNYARMIINIFNHHDDAMMNNDQLYWCGQAIATVTDIMLDKVCSIASNRANLIAGQSKDLAVFLKNLKILIQNTLGCDGVAIFLVNEGGDKLELCETTGTSWNITSSGNFYKKGEGLTGQVWERNETLLTVNSLFERGHAGKSEETVEQQKQHACLWVPFVDSKGNVIGIVRCRNKKSKTDEVIPNMFTDDDTAVLDAIGQAVVPHLQILLDKDRRSRALGRLTHELRVPLVSIRGAAELMQRTKGVEKLFEHDYPGDIWSWSELMRRLLGNADLFRYSPGQIPIQASPTLLLADVIAPAVKQCRILLEERGFSIRNINYGTFEKIPKLWVDRNQFQQVIFNLISNAIKHCFSDPSSFQVEIDGKKADNEFVIQVKDWGPGINSEMKDSVFEEGIRTSEAIQRNITGQGLGLWVVKEIIIRHGGDVKLTSLKQPTEISIFLPEQLSKKPPINFFERRNK